MTFYLLDSSAISRATAEPTGLVARRMADTAGLATSVMVAAELRFGAQRRGSLRLTNTVNEILANLVVWPFDDEASVAYARIRHDLEARGLPIGALDTLIAAHAVSRRAVLVTENVREFARVKGLRVEDWGQN